MSSSPLELSIIVPNFNEPACLEELAGRIHATLASISLHAYEIIFVDDGSQDHSREILRTLSAKDSRVKALFLSRNFGHQFAITAGFDHARGEAVLVMDADLQDPPEIIPDFVKKWGEGFDIVYGVRLSRAGESWFKRSSSAAFYRMLRALTRTNIPLDSGDFKLLSRQAMNMLNQLRERSRFMRGLVSWIGYPQAPVHYHRAARFTGETRYPVRKMVKLALDAILAFSDLPLRIATWVGFTGIVVCLAYLSYILAVKIMLGTPVKGWTSLVAITVFIGSVQLTVLGVMGQYVERIYEEIKGRPLYIVMEREGFGDGPMDPPLPGASTASRLHP